MQPLCVAAHLLLDDGQLQLDPELPPAVAACLLSSPIFHAPVLHFAHDALVFCRHHSRLSSVPLLSRSSSVWKANPSASPGQVPLSFEVLLHIATHLGCLCCPCHQGLTPCAFTSCSVHYLSSCLKSLEHTVAAPNVHFAILFEIVQLCYQNKQTKQKQIEWMRLIKIKCRE